MKKGTACVVMFFLCGMCLTARADLLTVGHTSGYDYKTITHAMAAAVAGDRITVAAGTYSADNPSYPEVFPIEMKQGVTLIRASSDIIPVIDATQTGRVFTCTDIPENVPAWIEGFKITGGYLDSGMMPGAGILVTNACVTLNYCDITQNTSTGNGAGLSLWSGSKVELQDCAVRQNTTTATDSSGGGISTNSSELILKSCDIRDNQAQSTGGGIYTYDSSVSLWKTLIAENHAHLTGGGIHFDSASAVRTIQMEQCNISENSSNSNGGGVSFSSTSIPEPFIGFCRIEGNSAQGHGGGISVYGGNPILAFLFIADNASEMMGGGIYADAASPKVIACSITGNTSVSGAGVYGNVSSLLLLNDLLAGNHASEFGGAIYAIDSSPAVTNCTMAGNYAGDGGGAVALNSTDMAMSNSILWTNSIDEIFQTSSTLTVQYCDVHGGYAGTGNIDMDPEFVSSGYHDYFLSQTASGEPVDSPCVDAGSDLSTNISYSSGGETFRMSDTTTRSDRVSDAGIVDMGYHSYRNPTECFTSACTVIMPSQDYGSGDVCYCDVTICNAEWDAIPDTPVFVLLEVAGVFFFAPEFDDFAFYRMTVQPGLQYIHVLPRFSWPSGVGSASGITWYAAMTDPDITQIVGDFGTFTFGWH